MNHPLSLMLALALTPAISDAYFLFQPGSPVSVYRAELSPEARMRPIPAPASSAELPPGVRVTVHPSTGVLATRAPGYRVYLTGTPEEVRGWRDALRATSFRDFYPMPRDGRMYLGVFAEYQNAVDRVALIRKLIGVEPILRDNP